MRNSIGVNIGGIATLLAAYVEYIVTISILLLETGDAILLETGDYILLEAQ